MRPGRQRMTLGKRKNVDSGSEEFHQGYKFGLRIFYILVSNVSEDFRNIDKTGSSEHGFL